MSDQSIAKETVGNKDSRANSGPWEPFGDDKGAEENRNPSDAPRPGAQGRDLCPSLPPPFEVVSGAPWVGKTMRSPWERRTYPGDTWRSSLPFTGPTQAFPVNVNPGGNRPAAWYPWEANDLKRAQKGSGRGWPELPVGRNYSPRAWLINLVRPKTGRCYVRQCSLAAPISNGVPFSKKHVMLRRKEIKLPTLLSR